MENLKIENIFFNFKDLRDKYVNKFKNDKKYHNLNYLQIKSSDYGKNYDNLGVFAKKKFNVGDLIELSPIIKLYEREKRQNDEVILNYAFKNNPDCKCYNCLNYGRSMYIGLGYASIYNSKIEPNSKWSVSTEDNVWLNIASKIIEKDEEIFI